MNVKTALLVSGAVALLVAGGVLLGATLLPAQTNQALIEPVATLRPTPSLNIGPIPTLPQDRLSLSDPLPPVPTLPPHVPPPTRSLPPASTSAPPLNMRAILTGRKIGIDPRGQQMPKPDPNSPGAARNVHGASGVRSGVFAHEINLAVAKKLRILLQSAGATVVMTRETGAVDISDLHRAQLMNDANAELVLRIDCGNAIDQGIAGASLITPAGAATGPIEARSKVAGEFIFQEFIAATGSPSLGATAREGFGFNWSSVPVCEIVLGHLSNEHDDILLNDNTYLDRCADGLLRGIARFFE